MPDKVRSLGQEARKYMKSIKLLETMKADYDRIENGDSPLFLYRQVRKERFDSLDGKTKAWHCVEKRKQIKRIYWTNTDESKSLIPTVYIDADLDPKIAEQFFPELMFKEYYAERKCNLWQLASASNSLSQLNRDDSKALKLVQRRLNKIASWFKDATNNEKNVLLITYKALLEDEKITIPTPGHRL